MLKNSTRIVTQQPFSPELLLSIIKKYNVSALHTHPQAMLSLLRSEGLQAADLDSVQSFIVAGHHVSQASAHELNAKLKNGRVWVVYGASEVGGHISVSGKLVPGVSVKIINDEGASLGANEQGEICVYCEVPMSGYYRNEKQKRNSFVDNWWHSGDIGFVEKTGDLHVMCRREDLVRYMGHTVNPTEIESVVQALPGVVSVAVIGIADPICENLVAAVVQKDPNSDLGENTIIELVETSLSNHNWLRGGVHFVDKMPFTVSGKLLKRRLMMDLEFQRIYSLNAPC